MSGMSGRCPRPMELTRAQVSGSDDAELRAHLAECARCAADWAAHARVTALAADLPVAAPLPEHSAQVRSALLMAARAGAARQVRPVRRIVLSAAVLCAAGLAAAVGLRWFDSRAGTGSPPGPEQQAAVAPIYRGTVNAHEGARFIRVGGVPDEIVRLTDGTITVEVDKLQPGERFRVITNDGEVEVRGTAFDVAADADRLRAVHVLHGRVEVRPERAPMVALAAGQRWQAEQVASVEPAPEPARAPEPVTAPAPTPRPRKPAVAAAPRRPAHDDVDAGARPADKRPIERFFEEGWAALAANDPARAAEAFARAARSAPDDPLAEDAWFWRGSALARAGRSNLAIPALASFIDDYPRSPRAGEASAMLGWLLLDADDVDGAEARFRAAARDRVDAVRTSAAKGLEAVKQRRR